MSDPRDPARLRALADECETIIGRRADCLRIQEAAAFAEAISLLRALAEEQEKQLERQRPKYPMDSYTVTAHEKRKP